MALTLTRFATACLALLLSTCVPSHGNPNEGAILWQYIEPGFVNFTSHWNVGYSSGDPCTNYFPHLMCDPSRTDVVWLNLAGLNLRGHLVKEIANLTALQKLWVQNNHISGDIPASVGNMKQLQWLDLSSNNFSGEIPPSLGHLPNLLKLNLSYNDLSGSIPEELHSFCSSGAFDGNLRLDMSPCRVLEPSLSPSPWLRGLTAALGVVVICGALLLALWLCVRGPGREGREEGGEKGSLLIGLQTRGKAPQHGRLQRLSLMEVAAATAGSVALAEGLAKGTLPEGRQVTIRRLEGPLLAMCVEKFTTGVDCMSRALHANVLPLWGYCMEGGERLLLGPFLANRAVADHLQGGSMEPIPLQVRPIIARDVAEGLSYLHCGCEPPLLHRNFKPEKVLLGVDYRAVVAYSYFGRQSGEAKGGETARLAPELRKEGVASQKTDVYAFGVFLAELVLGRSLTAHIETLSAAGSTLQEWISLLIERGGVEAEMEMEPLGAQSYGAISWKLKHCLNQLLHVAVLCLAESPEQRLTMAECTFKLKEEDVREHWGRWRSQDSVSLAIPEYLETLILPNTKNSSEAVQPESVTRSGFFGSMLKFGDSVAGRLLGERRV